MLECYQAVKHDFVPLRGKEEDLKAASILLSVSPASHVRREMKQGEEEEGQKPKDGVKQELPPESRDNGGVLNSRLESLANLATQELQTMTVPKVKEEDDVKEPEVIEKVGVDQWEGGKAIQGTKAQEKKRIWLLMENVLKQRPRAFSNPEGWKEFEVATQITASNHPLPSVHEEGDESPELPFNLMQKYAAIYNKNGRIGIYTKKERLALLDRFKEKRRRRVWHKKVRYSCRKNLAQKRRRYKGRFVKFIPGGEEMMDHDQDQEIEHETEHEPEQDTEQDTDGGHEIEHEKLEEDESTHGSGNDSESSDHSNSTDGEQGERKIRRIRRFSIA